MSPTPPRVDTADSGTRPFWSVMIPTYNPGELLGEALRSVLAQDPGPEHMQIQVVDDHSTRSDGEAIVREVAGNRVEFYRQSINVRHAANFNTCLARARGEVVHVLHDDDHVLDGFYAALEPAFREHPGIGAAFTRFIYAHGDGHWHSLSPLEARQAGVLDSFLGKIARGQRITTPCIAVRRSVYEAVGGFDPRFTVGGEDWEMWVRIATHAPVWFEPEPLAVYRMYRPGSLTGNARHSAALAQDMLMATDIVAGYLSDAMGEESARAALSRARAVYSKWAVEAAVSLVRARRWRDAGTALNVARAGVSIPHLAARVAQMVGAEAARLLKSRIRGG